MKTELVIGCVERKQAFNKSRNLWSINTLVMLCIYDFELVHTLAG